MLEFPRSGALTSPGPLLTPFGLGGSVCLSSLRCPDAAGPADLPRPVQRF